MSFSSHSKDFLWLQLRDLPYFRGVLRAVESRFYQDIELPRPILDLGCGDGHFVTITFDEPIDFGIDPWTGPVHQAEKRGGYTTVVQGNGDKIPVSDGSYATVMSNSVLEHIPDLDPVLAEVHRVSSANRGTFRWPGQFANRFMLKLTTNLKGRILSILPAGSMVDEPRKSRTQCIRLFKSPVDAMEGRRA